MALILAEKRVIEVWNFIDINYTKELVVVISVILLQRKVNELNTNIT